MPNSKLNRKWTLIIGAIALAFLLSLLLMNSKYLFNIDGDEALGHLIIGILISLISGCFAVIVWDAVIRKEKIQNENLLVKRIHEQFVGIKEIDIASAYEKAEDYINNCSEIRIIGVPDITKDSINKYLLNTLNKIKDNKRIKYKRICPLNINKQFEDHLIEILKENEKKEGNEFYAKILLLDDFAPAYTYFIVDQKYLLLTLSLDGKGESFRYYTEIEGIVKNFSDHFDDVWRNEQTINNKIITSATTLPAQIIRHSKLNKHLASIKNSINELDIKQKNTDDYTFEVLARITERIESISKNELILDHAVKKWNLLNTFSFFMSKLREDGEYVTISFPEFWKDILKEETDTTNTVHFLVKNKLALDKKAKIKRILILPKRFWTGMEIGGIEWEWNDVSKMIKDHLAIFKNDEYKYEFKILIVEEDVYKFDREHFLNFAIITYGPDEKIMFTPRRAHNQTEIIRYYTSAHDGETNKETFIEKEEQILEKENEHKNQILSLEELTEFKKIDPIFFSEITEQKMQALFGIKYQSNQ